MSIRFNESASNYLSITDAAALSLPDADWCIAIWEATSDNSGSGFQVFLSAGTINTANSIQLYFGEASSSYSGQLIVNIMGGGATNLFVSDFDTGSVDLTSGIPRLWVIQRNNDDYQCYSCEAFSAPVQQINITSPAVLALVNPDGNMNIGRRDDGNTARAYAGDLGHYFQGDFALSEDEIRMLACGAYPWEFGKLPNFYLPMTANVSAPPDLIGGLSVSRNGTLADGVGFPPDLRGFMNAVVFTPASGIAVPIFHRHYANLRAS